MLYAKAAFVAFIVLANTAKTHAVLRGNRTPVDPTEELHRMMMKTRILKDADGDTKTNKGNKDNPVPPTENRADPETTAPTAVPTGSPTRLISEMPSMTPVAQPTASPTSQPTRLPTSKPAAAPSGFDSTIEVICEPDGKTALTTEEASAKTIICNSAKPSCREAVTAVKKSKQLQNFFGCAGDLGEGAARKLFNQYASDDVLAGQLTLIATTNTLLITERADAMEEACMTIGMAQSPPAADPCCQGASGCTSVTGSASNSPPFMTVAITACTGDGACKNMGPNSLILDLSCTSVSACESMNENEANPSVTGVTFVGEMACTTAQSCEGVGRLSYGNVAIHNGACTGLEACNSVGRRVQQSSPSFRFRSHIDIGLNACVGSHACKDAHSTVNRGSAGKLSGSLTIGDGGCDGEGACEKIGFTDRMRTDIIVPPARCNGIESCRGCMTKTECGTDEVYIISDANGACPKGGVQANYNPTGEKVDEYCVGKATLPTDCPTFGPTPLPTVTFRPTSAPTISTEPSPTPTISLQPSSVPTLSSEPSSTPTISLQPSSTPTISTEPSSTPTISLQPSSVPTLSSEPSSTPTISLQPSSTPTKSSEPSSTPTISLQPSSVPTLSSEPSSTPTISLQPSSTPTKSSEPSSTPTISLQPSSTPTISLQPSSVPTLSSEPSSVPTTSSEPSSTPTISSEPSSTPTISLQPSSVPTLSLEPSSVPSAAPTVFAGIGCLQIPGNVNSMFNPGAGDIFCESGTGTCTDFVTAVNSLPANKGLMIKSIFGCDDSVPPGVVSQAVAQARFDKVKDDADVTAAILETVATKKLFTGSAGAVTDACGDDCCVGSDACSTSPSSGVMTVSEASCDGDTSCLEVFPDTLILNSCKGLSACQNFGQFTTTQPNAAVKVGYRVIGPGACSADASCSRAVKNIFGNVRVQTGACSDVNACLDLGTRASQGDTTSPVVANIFIGKNACTGRQGCNSVHEGPGKTRGSLTIEDGACIGRSVCTTVAYGDEAINDLVIKTGVCDASQNPTCVHCVRDDMCNGDPALTYTIADANADCTEPNPSACS